MKWRTGFVAAAALAAAMLTSACMGAGVGQIASPSAVADKTTLDERGLLGAELSYKTARTLAEAAVDGGLVGPTLATRMMAANKQAKSALDKARAAYDAANAASYGSAIREAEPLIASLWSLLAEKEKSNGA